MSEKKLSRRLRKRGKARGEAPGVPPEVGFTMPSETAQAEGWRDPRDGTAAVPRVTDAMMDHAAHEAAALAAAIAHHTVAPDRASVAEGPEALEGTVEAVGAAMSDGSEAAVPLAEDPSDGAERMAEAARDIPSASADILGRYNAKVFEMMRSNAASTHALFAALIQAKSAPEALSLNADHLRRQMQTLTDQGRELATLAQRIALDALRPLKGPAEP